MMLGLEKQGISSYIKRCSKALNEQIASNFIVFDFY